MTQMSEQGEPALASSQINTKEFMIYKDVNQKQSMKEERIKIDGPVLGRSSARSIDPNRLVESMDPNEGRDDDHNDKLDKVESELEAAGDAAHQEGRGQADGDAYPKSVQQAATNIISINPKSFEASFVHEDPQNNPKRFAIPLIQN